MSTMKMGMDQAIGAAITAVARREIHALFAMHALIQRRGDTTSLDPEKIARDAYTIADSMVGTGGSIIEIAGAIGATAEKIYKESNPGK